jgi:hypothetical protein
MRSAGEGFVASWRARGASCMTLSERVSAFCSEVWGRFTADAESSPIPQWARSELA